MASSSNTCKGTVAWFDVKRGFGFIAPEDGGENLFVHNSSIKAMGYRSLVMGDVVEFVVAVDDDGRKRAISVTGPGGAYIKGRRYFDGACYSCGEIGHKMMDCGGLGPCYSCGVMGHLARDCPAARVEPSSPIPNLFNPLNLGLISHHSLPMVSTLDLLKENSRTLSEQFSENSNSKEKEKEDDEIKDEDKEISRGPEERNWAELPRDILWIIFEKIAAVEIIRSAQFVCRMWLHLSYEPYLWRRVRIQMPNQGTHTNVAMFVALIAVKRSKGCMEEFYFECLESDGGQLLSCISDRPTKLRRLRLVSINIWYGKHLAKVLRKFSLLEDFEISFCSFSTNVIKFIGPACPQLKSFSLNVESYKDQIAFNAGILNAEALAIAKHMKQLHRLQIIGNSLTNVGLLAILNSCPNLQYLDIRTCFNVNVDVESLKQKLAMIKELRVPHDSTVDYEFHDRIVVDDSYDYYSSDNDEAYDDNYLDHSIGYDDDSIDYDDDSTDYDDDGYFGNNIDDLFGLHYIFIPFFQSGG